jgi:PHD/YefM family antitoxin component YafN of YafNO toxin-antitoxin module
MQKSISEFVSLPEAELTRIIDHGPVLVTQDDEPRFVAQSIDAFEQMVRRLRELEAVSKRRSTIRSAQIIPFRR